MKRHSLTTIPDCAHVRATVLIGPALALIICCSSPRRLERIRKEPLEAQIELAENSPLPRVGEEKEYRDTLVIRNIDGHDMIVMKTIVDDDGNTVANRVLEAARVTARFRNVAERHGRIDLMFQIHVPAALQESRWQLRYQPTMFIQGDSVKLEQVMVTGRDYRKKQLRGYQQYDRFISRIITDSTRFINLSALEVFLRRNIPQVYAFRNDSSYVSDEVFNSAFGVSEKEAIDHYTDKIARHLNTKRQLKKDRMFRKFVKAPIYSDGIRLDTVLLDGNGDYIYDYTQTIATRPGLKKVDIVLDGGIFEQEKKLCDIARSKPVNFYISSVSAFVDDSDRFLTKIVERKAVSNSSYRLDFKTGRSEIYPDLGDNAACIDEIKSTLSALAGNGIFQLDSITVTASASPEGSRKSNSQLSRLRSESVCRYFLRYVREVEDSLEKAAGFAISVEDGKSTIVHDRHTERISFKSASVGEDWDKLDILVAEDETLSEKDKAEYAQIKAGHSDPDAREREMSRRAWYPSVRERLYPMLRSVDFTFHLHRRGMLKDTIHTTVLDSVYMAGVEAIKDRDYDRAIELLRPYNDYNTAVAYCAKDFNHSALAILENCGDTAPVNYMLALLYARLSDERKAVEKYLRSCRQDPKYIHRGNLDPEICALIKGYGLDTIISSQDPTGL